jgi:G6PDH family F420-dependent oxidoreductase
MPDRPRYGHGPFGYGYPGRMTQFGYTMLCEQSSPRQLIADLVRAEEAGFDYAVISDHYFPWLEEQGHSPYAWSVLGAAAQATARIPLMTHVTCPIMRYHPAVVAQKAATMGVLSDGRFTLGLGAGENLNEHVVGRGWPSADVRHDMFAEAVKIIRLLLDGDYVTYRGAHFAVDSAKLYDLPDDRVPIAIAASGPESVEIARGSGDALIAVEPRADLIESFAVDKPRYGMVPLAYDTDREASSERAHRLWRWGLAGWKVMAELPGPVNFDAYSRFVRPEDVAEQVAQGPDLDPYIDAVGAYVEAGFTHVTLCQIGAEEQKTFLDWAEDDLLPALRGRFS